MVFGKRALALERRHHRRLDQLGQLLELGARLGVHHTLARAHHRSLGGQERARRRLHVAGVARRRRGLHRLVRERAVTDVRHRDVRGDLDHHRPRTAHLQQIERAAHDLTNLVGQVQGLHVLRHGGVGPRRAEERKDLGAIALVPERQHQHRHGVRERRRHAREGVLRAGAVLHGEHADAPAVRGPREPVRDTHAHPLLPAQDGPEADDRVASTREVFERRCAWQKAMRKAGWIGIAWPTEHGGRAASIIERVIWDEEYAAARAPVLPGMGLNLVGPTIIHWGTDEQKHRYLPRILDADEIWAQGFSEPGAGSDLASLATRAEDRGDHFLVNGQKVWTSGAQYAHAIILLVRTDPSAPKHDGISCLLVDMSTPGIAVRPLVLATGHHHFNEVFFTDVVVPKRQLLGPLNGGWKVSTTTLMYERHSSGARNPIGQVRDLLAAARRLPVDGGTAWDDPRIRQRLAQLYIDCEAMKYTRFRALTRQNRAEPPGPEGSILKLSGSELRVRSADAAGEVLGMHALVNRGSELVPDAPRWLNRLVAARQYTISAGTSEIQRNILGERVLGLPKG